MSVDGNPWPALSAPQYPLSQGPVPSCRSCRAVQFADLRQLGNGEGATSFLAAPVVLEGSLLTPRPAVAALLLAYTSASAAPQE